MVNPALLILVVVLMAAPGCRAAGEHRAASEPARPGAVVYPTPEPPTQQQPSATKPLPSPDELWDKLARALERAEFIRGRAYDELLDILEVLGQARTQPPASDSERDEVERVRQRAAELLEELDDE